MTNVASVSTLERLQKSSVALLLAVLIAVLSITQSKFATSDNVLNLLQQNAIIGTVALGMLVMMIAGGFDLSVGAVGAGSSVAAAYVLREFNPVAAILAAAGVGLVIGLVNGLLIARVHINAFVATLGSSTIATGVLFVVTEARPIYEVPATFDVIGLQRTAGIPNAFMLFALLALITHLLLHTSRLGRHIYAVGGNREASDLAGINVDRVTIAAFVFGALMAAVGGLMLVGQTRTGQPSAADGWPLLAIAACVVGGVSLAGGVGTVFGTVVGVALLGVISNGLNLAGVSPYWKPVATGVILIASVFYDSYQKGRRA